MYQTMRELFLTEINRDLEQHSFVQGDIITEEDIARLPEPVQRYFRYCGYIGKEKMINARVIWGDANLKLKPGSGWRKIDCYQYNSVIPPARIVYMKHKLAGMLPLEARDKFQDGHGNMFIRLMNLFTVANATGHEMDVSALVTILAEALIVPCYALQDYIKWEVVDENTARAILTCCDMIVSGIFHFDVNGEMLWFETDDRFYSETGKEYKRLKWSAIANDYMEKDGIRFPSSFKAVWHMTTGQYAYFKGTISNILFNVREYEMVASF